MPPYLRAPHGARLRNLRLSRLEIYEIAIAFWRRYDESAGGDGEGEGEGGLGVRASFEAFVTERAEAARWDAVARASWAHSVLDACKVWGGTGLSDVALLRESLLGAPLVPRAAQRAMLGAVRAAFDEAHAAEGKGWLLVRSGSSLASAANKMSSAGELKRSSIAPTLRRLFPSRAGEQIEELAQAIS